MSKLLARIDAEIARATDESVRGELRAKKAGYLARLGAFPESQGLIAELRAEFRSGQSPLVSIWIMLAEGLLYTFRDMSDEGADRIMRANLLANATRDRALIATTSAWRAFAQSERSEFKGMVRSLDNAFANSESSDHEVLARLYMILGNARMSVGDREKAQNLYMYCRHHAIECGDQATMDAWIYNKAAFALAWFRARMCFGEEHPDQLRQLKVELASAKTYQQMVGVVAFSNFVYLWEARLLSLAGEYESAITALRQVRTMEPFARYNYNVSLVDLEIAYCKLLRKELDPASVEVAEAMHADLSGLHNDDKLVASWLRCKLVEAVPELGDRDAMSATLASLRAEFDSSCAELRQTLGELREHTHITLPQVTHPKSIH